VTVTLAEISQIPRKGVVIQDRGLGTLTYRPPLFVHFGTAPVWIPPSYSGNVEFAGGKTEPLTISDPHILPLPDRALLTYSVSMLNGSFVPSCQEIAKSPEPRGSLSGNVGTTLVWIVL